MKTAIAEAIEKGIEPLRTREAKTTVWELLRKFGFVERPTSTAKYIPSYKAYVNGSHVVTSQGHRLAFHAPHGQTTEFRLKDIDGIRSHLKTLPIETLQMREIAKLMEHPGHEGLGGTPDGDQRLDEVRDDLHNG